MSRSEQSINAFVRPKKKVIFLPLPLSPYTGLYIAMDMSSGMIVESELVHVSQADNSSSMEKRGLRTVLERLQDAAITVSRLATDGNIQVTAMMKKEWPHIDHQFDVWHFAKIITKSSTKCARKSPTKILECGFRACPIIFGGVRRHVAKMLHC